VLGIPEWSKKTALIIYEPDCTQHVQVIRELTRLLQSQCNFKVLSEMTRHEQIRHSKTDFVLDSVKQADVVLIVVSENLRAAWQARQQGDNRSTRVPSVGELLLQSVRNAVVLRSKSVQRVAVRFDYTPAMTDVDSELAVVSKVYELMRDINQLLLTLRGVKKSTQLLTLTCCLKILAQDSGNVVDTSKLTESVAAARQHYQQQVPVTDATADLMPRHDTSKEITPLDTAQHRDIDVHVDGLPSNPTSGYASALASDLHSAGGQCWD